MAMPATTARRSEPNQHKFHPDTPRSPTTDLPRPSISPLSAKASPIAVRDPVTQNMESEDVEENGASNVNYAEVGDQDDDRSSSLSDPDDDLEEDEHLNSTKSYMATAEELAAHQSLEVDSEAETERLDQTPTKLRKDAESVGKTPSKLSQAAAADDELSDPPSPIQPVAPGAASSTSTVDTAGTPPRSTMRKRGEQSPTDTLDAGRKRKRSETAESSLSSVESDLDESPRKRSHSGGADDSIARARNANQAHIAGIQTTNEEAIADESDLADAQPVLSAKGFKGKKGPKPKGKSKKDAVKEAELPQPEESVQVEEQSDEALAKSAEELERKQAAAGIFENLAKQFTSLREKMCNEKLAAVNAELDMLNQHECKHPEYLRQVACIDARYRKQASETQAFYRFKHESLRRSILGERSQLHSQHFQFARQKREDIMDQLGRDWYSIQNERRANNQDRDEMYIRKFPTKKSDQIKEQAKYNQEVSILSGIAKYVGFPAAPDILGAQGDALEEDLKSMKISKRPHQLIAHSQPVYFPNRTGLVQPASERIAHEQFIEQNPWARSQGPLQHHGTPNLTHTPNWAEPSANSAKELARNLSGGIGRSPYATPMPQRRAPPEHSSSGTVPANSDPVEPPSSVTAGLPTDIRPPHAHIGRDAVSPLPVNKNRQHNGAELTGFRNISNMSGASTIDAPDSAERNREEARESLPGIPKEASAPQQAFDTSQLHRFAPESQRQAEVYANTSFRPQEGAYGTPTPLPLPNGPP